MKKMHGFHMILMENRAFIYDFHQDDFLHLTGSDLS